MSNQDQYHTFTQMDTPFQRYQDLYKAALEGNWNKAKELVFMGSGPNPEIFPNLLFTLAITIVSGRTAFALEMVKLMPNDALELKDNGGFTILYGAIFSGNTKVAKALVEKNPNLPNMFHSSGDAPILYAAQLGHKDILWHLCNVTKDDHPNSPFRGSDGLKLLNAVITADFYDVALFLINRHPELATAKDSSDKSALDVFARRPTALKSGSTLGFWQRCIYSCVHIEQASITNQHKNGDMEDPPLNPSGYSHKTQIGKVLQKSNALFWSAIKHIVPSVKHVYNTKVMHIQASELLNFICTQVSRLSSTQEENDKLLATPIFVAAEYGNVEFILTCIKSNPTQIWSPYPNSILHIAIRHRQEKVFNLVRGMGLVSNSMVNVRLTDNNNALHLAAKLGPPSKLNVVSGAALQVQRELQWYQEVEKLVQPIDKEMENNAQKTPRVLFTEEHKDLIQKGEKWMKDMASSSMVVATLIATVVFAAAFTVPGGNNDNNGIPNFLKVKWFKVFAISNALALFSSLTSVLIFLSILTSRYAEEDFLKSLPQKLIIGLAMLFFSIAAMMIAFSATYFIMLGHQLAMIALPLALLACFPVTLFALLQLPLFIEVILSTYGSDVFSRREVKWSS